MGGGASSERKRADRLLGEGPPYNARTKMLVVSSRRKYSSGAKERYRREFLLDSALVKKGRKGQRRVDFTIDEESCAMVEEADPVTLQVLHLVGESDKLSLDKADLRLRMLNDCYPLLEQVPPARFDHLAVLVYQKEGDLYYSKNDIENAKTTYSRAIQIAETRVARGEKEIYMVLKRYVLAMVGMSRLWFEQERDTTGFTLADKREEEFANTSDDESVSSRFSGASSVLSDSSVFSLNREILKTMAPQQPRRRVGPVVSVVKLKAPSRIKVRFSTEDDFVLRSEMTRELKASPCELLLLRCIEVVELGHRRQSELLIPALIDLAQIYEHLELYNRSLLLIRRCLGILCNVYDYDHPWIVQLRSRADYLMELMDNKQRDTMATMIQATWKMHRAMVQLSKTLGRPVIRHVWNPRIQQDNSQKDFLHNFVNELPDGTVLHGAYEGGDISLHPFNKDARSLSNIPMESYTPSIMGSAGDTQNLRSESERLSPSAHQKAQKTTALNEYPPPESRSISNRDDVEGFDDDDDEPYIVDGLQSRQQTEATYTPLNHQGKIGTQKYVSSPYGAGTVQTTRIKTEVRETTYDTVLTGDGDLRNLGAAYNTGVVKNTVAVSRAVRQGGERSTSLSLSTRTGQPAAGYDTAYPGAGGAARDAEKRSPVANSRGSSEQLPAMVPRSTSGESGASDGLRPESSAGSCRSSVQSQLESRRQVRSWRASSRSKDEV